MENKKKKSTGLLLSILGVISLVLITAGVTYAFFSYAKQGEKQNTISTGSITFIYNETGNALSIQDALPKEDSIGIGENATKAFVFQVESTTPSTAYINYIVTARKGANSTLPEDQVKLYLTAEDVTRDGSTGITPGSQTGSVAGQIKTFADLTPANATNYPGIFATNAAPGAGVDERVIYVGQVPASSANKYTNHTDYTQNFKLNMWLKGGVMKCYNGSEVVAAASEAACKELNESYVWKADMDGVDDYSAYEFVKKSAISGTTPVTIASLTSSRTATGAQLTDYNILTSVEYYKALEAGTISAANYERIAYVDYTNKTILTRSQAVTLNYATDTEGFAYATGKDGEVTVGTATMTANEQYYPLNGQTFTVTINVYAEGTTTYQAGA